MLAQAFPAAALLGSPEQGKVVLRTGVAEADFYLDGNFVAKTDKNDTLAMESFPSGTFRSVVKKTGCREFAVALRKKSLPACCRSRLGFKEQSIPYEIGAATDRERRVLCDFFIASWLHLFACRS